jgi:hypothetical protein
MDLADFSNPVMWLENMVVLVALYFAYRVAIRWRVQLTYYFTESVRRVGGAYKMAYLVGLVIFALCILYGLLQRFK